MAVCIEACVNAHVICICVCTCVRKYVCTIHIYAYLLFSGAVFHASGTFMFRSTDGYLALCGIKGQCYGRKSVYRKKERKTSFEMDG